MNNKLLVVCGPTATGKTLLAISLAKKFNGELISADSRQVYKNMDIGTGKEWGDVPIHGYDLVEPDQEFSVSAFKKFADAVIVDIQKRGKLPILVGGTGFYIKAVTDGISTISVPLNKNLRSSLEKLNINELYEKLAILDAARAATLNLSDKKNPRRLIRAIEIAQWKVINGEIEKKEKSKNDTFWVGLKMDTESLEDRILKRVGKRMDDGFIFEIESLLRSGVSWKNQSMKSLGYSQAEDFMKKGLSYEEFIEKWAREETKYAKRQMTWFKKEEKINWFDVENVNFFEKVERSVQKWYYREYAKKD